MWEPNINFNNNNNNNNVGRLVGGCGARAVSRKTPIFFIVVDNGDKIPKLDQS